MKSKEGQDLMYKACCLVCDWLVYDERAQVNGIVFVSDYTGASMDLLKYWSAEAEKKMLAYLQVNTVKSSRKDHSKLRPPSLLRPLVSVFQSQNVFFPMLMGLINETFFNETFSLLRPLSTSSIGGLFSGVSL